MDHPGEKETIKHNLDPHLSKLGQIKPAYAPNLLSKWTTRTFYNHAIVLRTHKNKFSCKRLGRGSSLDQVQDSIRHVGYIIIIVSVTFHVNPSSKDHVVTLPSPSRDMSAVTRRCDLMSGARCHNVDYGGTAVQRWFQVVSQD